MRKHIYLDNDLIFWSTQNNITASSLELYNNMKHSLQNVKMVQVPDVGQYIKGNATVHLFGSYSIVLLLSTNGDYSMWVCYLELLLPQ